MNKLFKITAVAAITLTAAGVFAAPPPKHNHKHKDNDGIRLATDIINLVDASVRLITGTPQTVVVNTVPPPPAPVVVTPPPQPPVIVVPPPPPPQTQVIVTHAPRYKAVPKRVTHHYGKPKFKPVKHNFAAQPGHFRR